VQVLDQRVVDGIAFFRAVQGKDRNAVTHFEVEKSGAEGRQVLSPGPNWTAASRPL
jgi:hypothetical protein